MFFLFETGRAQGRASAPKEKARTAAPMERWQQLGYESFGAWRRATEKARRAAKKAAREPAETREPPPTRASELPPASVPTAREQREPDFQSRQQDRQREMQQIPWSAPDTSRRQREDLLHEEILATPGGHRAHKLQRTSPGGTAHIAQYTSPPGVERFMAHYVPAPRSDWWYAAGLMPSQRAEALYQIGASEYGFFGVPGVAPRPHPCKGMRREDYQPLYRKKPCGCRKGTPCEHDSPYDSP